MPPTTGTPAYDDLPTMDEGSEERHAWDVWGRDDQVGAFNRLTPEHVVAAARLVRTGKVINLDLPLNEPDPPLSDRTRFTHHIETGRQTRDDWLDGFYLQGSSQWDALSHVRYRQYGYWGGRQDEDVNEGRECGIDQWAERGIVGRGVLIDAKRHYDCAPDERFPITGPMIEEDRRGAGRRDRARRHAAAEHRLARVAALARPRHASGHAGVGRADPGRDAGARSRRRSGDRGVAVEPRHQRRGRRHARDGGAAT